MALALQWACQDEITKFAFIRGRRSNMQAENARSVALAAYFRVFILVLLAVSLAAGLVKLL